MDFENMSRRTLQRLAKQHGIKVFLETHRVSGIGTKSKSSSKSNSSTRKKSK